MGEFDSNDTVHSRIHHDPKIIDLYDDIFSNYSMLERFETIKEYYQNYSNVYFKLYPNIGHDVLGPIIDDVRSFMYQNFSKYEIVKN